MNIILLFFALPIATIILAIVLEKILRCPILTALTFFAIYLIVTFVAFDATFLVFAIAYTILAFIAAYLAELFFNRCNCPCRKNHCCDNDNTNNNTTVRLSDTQIQEIAARVANIMNNNSCSCCNCNNDTATVNIRNQNGERTTWCCRRRA